MAWRRFWWVYKPFITWHKPLAPWGMWPHPRDTASQDTQQQEPTSLLESTGERENAAAFSSSVVRTWGQIIADVFSQSWTTLWPHTHTKNVSFSFWVRSKQLCNELINDPWKKNNTKLLNPCPEGCTHQLCRLIKAILFQEQPLRMGWWVSGCSSRSSYFTEMLSSWPGCGWQRFWGDTSDSRGWSSRRVGGGQQQFLK